MKTTAIIILFYLCSVSYVFSQEVLFKLDSKCQSQKSIFSKVRIIDMRTQNQTFGFVQTGALNELSFVGYDGNFTANPASFFRNDQDSAINQKELTVLIYEFYISEKTDRMKETGRLKFSMRFFINTNDNKFKEALFIDSIYTVNSLDVTKKLLESVSMHLCEIRSKIIELGKKSQVDKLQYLFSSEELLKLDSIEKSKILIYNSDIIKKGIYYSYNQFKNNTPDTATFTIDAMDLKDIKVFEFDKEKDENVEISSKNIYAVSDGYTLLKATANGFYKMYKENEDFYYLGKTSYTPNIDQSRVAMNQIAFGLIGAAIAREKEQKRHFFKLKIGYLTGSSIPISAIAD